MKNELFGAFSSSGAIIVKSKALFELLKFRLSLLVIFSAGFGFIMSSNGDFDFYVFSYLLIGGLCMTGAANILNQVLEKDLDILMSRTENRPLPSGRVSVQEALFFSLAVGSFGFLLLISKVNAFTAFLTLISLILYAFCYTPMKRVSSFAVLVGAFPGAMPPLIGWVANSNAITIDALTIFSLQFIWQFPHFWAIAWVLDDDYKKAGFRLLPSSGGRNANTAFQIMIYTLFLIPIGLLPTKFGIVGNVSAVVTSVCGLLFLIQTFYLMKVESNKAARSIMFGSFIYLPIVQITFMLDKM
ncbi:MAG: heme o synthase [Cytophagales bacterium]